MSRDPFRDIQILYYGEQGGIDWRIVAGTNTNERIKPKRIEIRTDEYDAWIPFHEHPQFDTEDNWEETDCWPYCPNCGSQLEDPAGPYSGWTDCPECGEIHIEFHRSGDDNE